LLTASRLAIGTVQFGLPYGVANHQGQVDHASGAAILGRAWAAGIDTLDTAVAYGISEQRLGEIGVARWRIVSKLPAVPMPCADIEAWVDDAVAASLRRLGITRMTALLLHQPGQLLESQGRELYAALLNVRETGRCGKIGISIYNPEELEGLWGKFQFDVVQAPLNVIDRRLVSSGWLGRLHDAGIEVHTRSAFLQGLLLMNAADRPPYFARWAPLWQRWHAWLGAARLSPLQGALLYLSPLARIDRIVVGVDSSEQLEQILAAAANLSEVEIPDIASQDPALVNPSSWNKL
jgi:aryl-alcohol dehydrogenase-like predicted oxidoreductase